jgi:hypothetical protein
MAGAIRLRVALAEDEPDYIRHARVQPVRAVGAHESEAMVAPLPYAVYLLARDADDRPVGLAEACFLQQHYGSWEEVPYAPFCDLPAVCPFPQLAGIRTVFAEPEARLHHGLYAYLILGMAYIFRTLGARYSTATTNAADARLARLYDKTGGARVAEFSLPGVSEGAIAVYLFDLDALLRHPATPRMQRSLQWNEPLLMTVRGRSRQAGETA